MTSDSNLTNHEKFRGKFLTNGKNSSRQRNLIFRLLSTMNDFRNVAFTGILRTVRDLPVFTPLVHDSGMRDGDYVLRFCNQHHAARQSSRCK